MGSVDVCLNLKLYYHLCVKAILLELFLTQAMVFHTLYLWLTDSSKLIQLDDLILRVDM